MSREQMRRLIRRVSEEIQETRQRIEKFDGERPRYSHWDHQAAERQRKESIGLRRDLKVADRKRKAEAVDGMETRSQKARRVHQGNLGFQCSAI